MEQSNPKITNNRILQRKMGTYALILHCRHERIIDTGKLGKMSVRTGCYVYVGSAFGSGGLPARIKHHYRISKSPHWHIDYLKPAVEITEVWYSHDPIKREHEWASILMGVRGVKLPLKGFGSTDCNCDSHLFFFGIPPSMKMFRKRIEQAIPNHHRIEWIDGNALIDMNQENMKGYERHHTLSYLTRREILKKTTNYLMAFFLMPFFSIRKAVAGKVDGTNGRMKRQMNLPKPRLKGEISVEQAIKHRRTIRSYLSKPLTLEQLSQICWAAQGITEDRGFKRSAPSGGALYPMDIYAVVGDNGVQGLKAGIYHYDPHKHSALLITEGDFREDVARTALSQMWMASAPLNLVITSEYSRITSKYGTRGERYAMIEAGHVGQNIFLQAEALGLRAGIVGAFHDNDVIRVMKIRRSHEPLLILPVGYGA